MTSNSTISTTSSTLVSKLADSHSVRPDASRLNPKPSEGSHLRRSVSVNKLEKRLRREVGRAIQDFNMISDGDRIMVCLSGGKDSYTMLEMLMALQRKAPVSFELTAINMDQKQPGFPEHVLPQWLDQQGVNYDIINRDTYTTVTRVIPEGKTMCGLCSRLRRGTLYGYAEEHGYNKIALGHHRDDIAETFFLNLFHGGTVSAMPPKLLSDDGKNIVIRPLAYCRETDIEKFARYREYPIIPCNLCGSQENLQRVQIKKMLRTWESDHPGRIESIFRAMSNIKPSQLADTNLFDFATLETRRAEPESGNSSSNSDIDKTSWLP